MPRSLVRVDKDTWDVRALERVTVQWEPRHDVSGFEFLVGLTEDNGDPWYVDWRMEGELISFQVPPVKPGTHTIWIAGGDEVDNANGCGGVPNVQIRWFHAHALLNVLDLRGSPLP